MDAFSGYIYSALWLIIAIYLFVQAFKTHRFLFFLSAYFLFMCGWYLANELLTNINLFAGFYSWILRGVSIAVLLVCAVVYLIYRSRRNTQTNESSNTPQ